MTYCITVTHIYKNIPIIKLHMYTEVKEIYNPLTICSILLAIYCVKLFSLFSFYTISRQILAEISSIVFL